MTTLGSKGAMVEQKGEPPVVVDCPAEERIADPTGVGDAFRAGYLAGVAWGLSAERCCQVGCAGMQLAQATVVHQSIIAQGANDDLGEYGSGFLVLPRLA